MSTLPARNSERDGYQPAYVYVAFGDDFCPKCAEKLQADGWKVERVEEWYAELTCSDCGVETDEYGHWPEGDD